MRYCGSEVMNVSANQSSRVFRPDGGRAGVAIRGRTGLGAAGRHHLRPGCGAATLAEQSVAVPFVSAVAGALAITQATRIASGKAHHSALTGDVGDLRTVRATIGQPPKRPSIDRVLAAA